MNKPQTHKSSGASGPRLPDFSALAAAVSSPSTSEPDFNAIAKLGDDATEGAEESDATSDAPADRDEIEAASPIVINTSVKPTPKAVPKAAPTSPTIQVAPTKPAPAKPTVTQSAPVKPLAQQPATSKPVVAKPTASKPEAKKPSLDFLSQAEPADEPVAPFEINTKSVDTPAIKVQVAAHKPAVEKRVIEKPVEKLEAEKPLKRASSAAASLPGFAEFAAIAGSISEPVPTFEAKAETPKPAVAVPESPVISLGETPKVAKAIEAATTIAPVISTAAVTTSVSKTTAGEAAPKKRSASASTAKNPLTYVTDVTAGLLFAAAGFQLYQAFSNNALVSGAPSAIATIGLGVGLIAISQVLRLLTRLSHELKA